MSNNNLQQPKVSVEGILDQVNKMSAAPATEGARAESREAAPAENITRGRRIVNAKFAETFEVANTNAVTALTVKVPNEVHAKLATLAMKNKFARNGSPRTIQDLVSEFIRSALESAA